MKSQEVRSFSLLLSGIELRMNRAVLDCDRSSNPRFRIRVTGEQRKPTLSCQFLMAKLFSSYSLFSLVHDRLNGPCVQEGVCELGGLVVEIEGKKVVIVDMEKKTIVKAEGVDLKEIKQNETLDLSVDGDRWEGDVLNGEPCGWGVLYDKNNNRVYEGFRIGEKSVGYGRCYYPDSERIEYEGEICDGMRWGRGIQYDRNGVVVYEGDWMKNDNCINRKLVVDANTSDYFPHSLLEELIIEDQFPADSSLLIPEPWIAPHLRVLEIGNGCFQMVSDLKLIGMGSLERVVIGSNCFTLGMLCKEFCLTDCPKLKELTIGKNSFCSYRSCVIENTPSLESIVIGTIEGSQTNGSFNKNSLELKSGFSDKW